MERADAEKIVLDAAITGDDGKLHLMCCKAFELNRIHSIPLKEIGRICDALKIRIKGCQLGLFD